jgi:hypothetical protein
LATCIQGASAIAGGTVLVRLEPKDFIVYRVLAKWAKAGVAVRARTAWAPSTGDGSRSTC